MEKNNLFFNEVLVTTLTKEDLEVLIIDCMNAVMRNHQPCREAPPSDGPNRPIFLTKKQAAEQLDCSRSTIDDYVNEGRLTRHYPYTRAAFDLEEVLALQKLLEDEATF